MNITYIAKHNSGGNDDEGSICYALTNLGHTVNCVREFEPSKRPGAFTGQKDGIVLFHKWLDVEVLQQIKVPKVFWYFDVIDFKCPSAEPYSRVRRKWMALATELCDLGFLTDGDWVNQDTSGKLHRLTQGADERILGRGDYPPLRPVIFPGQAHIGRDRGTWLHDMKRSLGSQFEQINRKYRRELADRIAAARVVVSPDSPVSDHYYSNRVYLSAGFGGCLVHPYCKTLEEQYRDGHEIAMYRDRPQMFELINYYLDHEEEAEAMGDAALRRTEKEHTYTHRCKTLMDIVERRT